ncbi:MAG: heparinase II/III family protein [Phycisphaerae bacterium]|nr:heparinase II/III family protein [Phycisphaerae bacterium]
MKAEKFALGVCLLLLAFGTCVQAANPSLAQRYPQEKLADLLLPHAQWHPFATPDERPAWDAVDARVRRAIIQLAEDAANCQIPTLPATLYLEYRRNGDRSRFQKPWFERRSLLNAMVLAECLEDKGRFLDPIVNVIWAICEESSWTLPAHIGAQKAGSGLPDTTEPVVALFSAETAQVLAWTHYLLGNRLNRVSPLVRPRIEREIRTRILAPFMERDDWGWMGFRSSGRPNNWNPWINSNVLAAGLLIETDQSARVALVHKVLRSLDKFFVPYPSDGSCDEGPGYWGRAGASLFDNLDLLHSASNGRIDYFDIPAVGEIGRFISRVHIAGDYFVPVGDCGARLNVARDLVYRFGKRIGDADMQTLAAWDVSAEMLFSDLKTLQRPLHAVFSAEQLLAAKSDSPPLLRDVWLADPDMQLMAARDRQGSTEGLYVAAWGAHNAQSHNHNDVGNVIVFADGRPFIIDVGRPTYTRQTFSSSRYDIWAMQSSWHNLPAVNGVMQGAGRQFAARDVKYESSDAFAQLRMDLAAAYPDNAQIRRWVRTVRLERGRHVEITDDFALSDTRGPVEENFITPATVKKDGRGVLLLMHPGGGTVRLRFDEDILRSEIENVTLDDASLRTDWGEHLTRIRLVADHPKARDCWSIRLTVD